MQERTIKDILNLLKKRLWLIAAVCVVAAAAATVYYQRLPDQYTAQTTLYVLFDYEDSEGQTRYDPYISELFAGDFKELIKTDTIMNRAIDRMGPDGAAFFSVTFDISAITGTRLLKITGTGPDPAACMRSANTVSQVFADYVKEVLGTSAVSIASQATLPYTPSGPDRTRNILLVMGICLILSTGVLMAVEMLNTTLRSADEAEAALALPVLASVQGYRRELEHFLQKPGKNESLFAAVSNITRENAKTLATNVQFAALAHPVRTLLVTSSVTNEGKSSLLLLLAQALAELGKRVLVVDMDTRNPSVGRYLGARGRYDLFDHLLGSARLEEVVCRTPNPNVFFIDSRHRLASATQMAGSEAFGAFMATITRMYDMVLFDTPPLGLFIDAAALANKVDGTLMVVGCGMVDRALVREAVEQLHKAAANILGIAMNFTDARRSHKYYYGKYRKQAPEENAQNTSLLKAPERA